MPVVGLENSPTIRKYKDTMSRCVRMYYQNIDQKEILFRKKGYYI